MPVFQSKIKPENADLVIIPVCWSLENDCDFKNYIHPIIEASNQVELFHEFYGYQRGCKIGIDLDYQPSQNLDDSVSRASHETNWAIESEAKSSISLINEDYKKLTSFIDEKVDYWLAKDKLVVVVGGGASISLGGVSAVSNLKKGFGLFHLSASPFLVPYEGKRLLEENSIYNIGVKIPELSKIVGVGYRSISQSEISVQKENKERIVWFSKRKNDNYIFNGDPFNKVAKRWVNNLPEFVYLSLHISVLQSYSVDEIEYVLQQIVESRRKIIGADLLGLDQLDKNTSPKLVAELLLILAKTYGRSRGKK